MRAGVRKRPPSGRKRTVIVKLTQVGPAVGPHAVRQSDGLLAVGLGYTPNRTAMMYTTYPSTSREPSQCSSFMRVARKAQIKVESVGLPPQLHLVQLPLVARRCGNPTIVDIRKHKK